MTPPPDTAATPPPLAAPRGDALFDYPTLYDAADDLALAYQARQRWVVRLNMLLAVANTAVIVIAALRVGFNDLWGLAVVAAIAFVLQAVVRRLSLDKGWFNGRALAEAVKGATWRYVEGAKPYDCDATEARTRFENALRLLRDQYGGKVPNLVALTAEAMRPTAQMEATRSLPLAERRLSYLTDRADDQIGWYHRKATANQQASNRLARAAQVAQILTVLTTIGRAVWQYPYAVIALCAVVATIANTWTQNGRHGELATAYTATENALVAARARIVAAATDGELDEAVTEAEDAIAREQSAWVVKRT